MTETKLWPTAEATAEAEIDHGFCSHCYKRGLQQGLCGTPMPRDAHIVSPDTPLTEPCAVCFAPGITCNNCARYF